MSKTRQNSGKYPEPYTRGHAVPKGGKNVGRLGNDGQYHVDGGIQDNALWAQGVGRTIALKPVGPTPFYEGQLTVGDYFGIFHGFIDPIPAPPGFGDIQPRTFDLDGNTLTFRTLLNRSNLAGNTFGNERPVITTFEIVAGLPNFWAKIGDWPVVEMQQYVGGGGENQTFIESDPVTLGFKVYLQSEIGNTIPVKFYAENPEETHNVLNL